LAEEQEDEDISFGEELPEKETDSEKQTEKQTEKQPEKSQPAPMKKVGASFGKSVEDKFKMSLLQVEKRFIDLETTVNELNQKISETDLSQVAGLSQRMDDVEDLMMVEQAGIMELKTMLEGVQTNLQKQAEQPQQVQLPVAPIPTISPEEIQKIIHPIESRLHQRISSLEKRIDIAPQQTAQTHPDEIQGLRARIDALQNRLNVLGNVKAEIEILRNKIDPLNAETMKSVVNELSDLRIETSREIREIKEKIGNAPLYADIQFLSNRVKDLKLNMDTLLNMKVEIDSKILNIERSMAEGGSSSGAGSSSLIAELESTKRDLIGQSKKLGSIERMMHDMATKIESLHGGEFNEKMRKIQEMESLSNKMQGMYEDLEKKTMDVSRMTPHNIQDEVTQLRAEMQHAISRMQSQAVSKSVDQIEILRKRISDMEDSIQSLHESARVQPVSSNLYDDQINELLQRILLLESRLAAFENMIERTQQMQSYQDTSPRPIILE